MKPIARFAAAMALASVPAIAAAHVTVWPKEVAAGAREKLVVRVPNEKQVDTVAVEVLFPAGVKVTAVEQKPGWMTEPLRDEAGALVGVRWSGKLAPHQFVEFGLLSATPAKAGTYAFPAVQSFADGSRSDWSGPAGSKAPAAQVVVRAKP